MTGSAHLERLVGQLPCEFETLRAEARVEGHLHLERLAADWAAGTMRFNRPGEGLLVAHSDSVLAGIGSLTIDPAIPDALRMRRFYVRISFRRCGIGRKLAEALLDEAFRTGRRVTVNAAIGSVPFWVSLGFAQEIRDGHTHIIARKGDGTA
jgi:GNAT superfamily N-acetyltransferase